MIIVLCQKMHNGCDPLPAIEPYTSVDYHSMAPAIAQAWCTLRSLLVPVTSIPKQ